MGQPTGGTRMRAYRRPEDRLVDALRLAEGMTQKWAAADAPFGGGKGVLALSRVLDRRETDALLRRYGRLVEALGGAFATAPDMNVGPDELAVIAGETQYVHCYDRVQGKPVDPGPYTALGVFVSIKVGARHQFGSDALEGRSVLVQGVGDVGGPLCRLLRDVGASVYLSDLNVERAERVAADVGGGVVRPDEAPDFACDVYAPCAAGAVLNARTIPRLRCKMVAGSANNQLDEVEDAERLHQLGILYTPDFVVNAGGAVGIATLEDTGSEAAARARVEEIGPRLSTILAEALERGESPVHAARRQVERVLERARTS